jgi:hypothetical protein
MVIMIGQCFFCFYIIETIIGYTELLVLVISPQSKSSHTQIKIYLSTVSKKTTKYY